MARLGRLGCLLTGAPWSGIESFALCSVLHLALVFLVVIRGGLLLLVGLLQSAEHVLLQRFLLQHKAVLVPNEVGGLGIELVAVHAGLEQLEDVPVVGVRGERERTAVLHVLLELSGLVQAQFVDRHLLLLALDVVVLLVLGTAWEALPGKRAAQEVEQHVANGLEIISARLLVANVCVQRGVTGGTSQVFALTEGNVLVFRVLVALGKTEVDDVDVVLGALSGADQEVVGLNISVDNPFFVHFLNALNLYSY